MIYFEDIQLEKVTTAGPYHLNETEIVEFSAKWDPFDFHTDESAADSSLFGGLSASGVHSVCIFNRLCHDMKDLKAIKAIVQHEVRYKNPARPGDRLTVQTKCISTKKSSSRPDIGIAIDESQLVNQIGDVILDIKSVLFVARRHA